LTFESVYREHSKTVARWTARLLGPRQDFEDAMQEVFLVVKRRLPEFRGEAEVTTWLYEITVRVVQRFRMRARWWAWVTGRGQRPSGGPRGDAFIMAHEAPSDPHALLEAREQTESLYRLLDELGEDQRTAFILFELEGLSGAEIAKITGVSPNTVWVRISRARRKFLTSMNEREARAT
jgi:RNA polymerase sigma-70 factor (ECF subfamily)